jgi:hypothetical protein
MRTAAAIVFGLALSTAAFGADGAPSREVLAEMGLGGMQVLSDTEAANIRGTGFVGFEGFHIFKDALRDYQKQVKHFHKLVKKFDRKLNNSRQPKHHDMKPPKMPHGGKPW